MSALHIFIRGLYFITATALWYFSVLWIALPFLVVYTYRYAAYELIALGVLLDMQFLTAGYIPYYTIFFTVWVMMAEWIKPRLRARDY